MPTNNLDVKNMLKSNPKLKEALSKKGGINFVGDAAKNARLDDKMKEEVDKRTEINFQNEVKVIKNVDVASKLLGLIPWDDEGPLAIVNNRRVYTGAFKGKWLLRFPELSAREMADIAIDCYSRAYTDTLKVGVEPKSIVNTFKQSVEIIKVCIAEITSVNNSSVEIDLQPVVGFNADEGYKIGETTVWRHEINTKEGNYKLFARYDEKTCAFHFEGYLDTLGNELPENFKEKEFLIFPVAIAKGRIDEIDKEVSAEWDSKKEEIEKAFVSKIKLDGTDEEKAANLEKIVPVLKKFLFENVNTDKYRVLYDLSNDKIPELDGNQFIQKNSGNCDVISVSSSLFPRYGEEDVDWSYIGLSENDEVVLDVKDQANYKIIGVNKEIFTQITQSAKFAYAQAKERLALAHEIISKNDKNYVEEQGKCIELAEKNKWFGDDGIYENMDTVIEYQQASREIRLSEDFLQTTKRSMGGMKMTSLRVNEQIQNGEFTNVYMVSCIRFLKDMLNKTLKISEEDNEKDSLPSKFFDLINKIYKNEIEDIDGAFRTDRFKKAIENSITINMNKNKFGDEEPNLFKMFSDFCCETISPNIVSEGLSDQDETDLIVREIQGKWNFFTALCREPLQLISKLSPEVTEAFSGSSTDADKKNKESLLDLGFEDYENSEELAKTISELKALIIKNKAILLQIIEGPAKASVAAFGKRVSSGKFKKVMGKIEILSRFIAISETTKYYDAICQHRVNFTGEVTLENKDKLAFAVIKQTENGEAIENNVSYEEWRDAPESDRMAYKPISDDEVDALLVDVIFRTIINTRFFNIIYSVMDLYTDECNTKARDNSKALRETPKMFSSAVNSFAAIIEVFELSNGKDENYKATSILNNDQILSMGKDAIAEVLKPFSTIDGLKACRKAYVTHVGDFLIDAFKESFSLFEKE